MIIKKLGIFFILLITGIAVGVYFINNISRSLDLSPLYTNFILAVYIGIFIVLALAMGKNIPKEEGIQEDAAAPEPEKGTGKTYAWLNPYGTEVKAGYPLTKKLTIIGRDVHADILINDLSVSRKHAQILSIAGGFVLKDLESGNGTFINNQRIDEAYLGDGDLVTFGEIKFIFSCKSAKPIMESTSSEIDISLDIDLDFEGFDTASYSDDTGSRMTGTKSGTFSGTFSGPRSGSRFKDLKKDKTYIPPGKNPKKTQE